MQCISALASRCYHLSEDTAEKLSAVIRPTKCRDFMGVQESSRARDLRRVMTYLLLNEEARRVRECKRLSAFHLLEARMYRFRRCTILHEHSSLCKDGRSHRSYSGDLDIEPTRGSAQIHR